MQLLNSVNHTKALCISLLSLHRPIKKSSCPWSLFSVALLTKYIWRLEIKQNANMNVKIQWYLLIQSKQHGSQTKSNAVVSWYHSISTPYVDQASTQAVCIFNNDTNTTTVYHGTLHRFGWIYVASYDTLFKERPLRQETL